MDYCTRCGGPVDDRGVVNEDQGYAYCESCENDYQRSLQERYPHGQCWQCGAEYREWTCAFGTVHTVAAHSEGGCSQWRDRGWAPDAGGPYCPEGCYQPGLWTVGDMWAMAASVPAPAPVFSVSHVVATDSTDPPLDDLPF